MRTLFILGSTYNANASGSEQQLKQDTCCAFRYLELHPFEMISVRVVYVIACTLFPVFVGYCIILGICFLMV